MDTFDTRGYYVAKIRVMVHPSLNELLLVETKPVGLDIPSFFQILRQVALFQPLDALIEGLPVY